MTRKTALSHSHLLAQEQGTICKEWGGKTPICLVFPNTYHVGMSNLGLQLLYGILNALPDVVCERAFLPDEGYKKSGRSLRSLESNKPLSDFQIIAFSIPFENDFLNVVSILEMSKIPLQAEARDQRSPLVVAGGAAVTLNPEPLTPFVDLFFIGEGEESLLDFLMVFQDVGTNGKEDLLKQAARIEGIYCPSLYEASYDEQGLLEEFAPLSDTVPARVRRRWVKDPTLTPSTSTILTPQTEFKEMFLIELNRGCPHRCRFCATRTIYRPFRNRKIKTLINEADHGLQRGMRQGRRIGVVGSALGDHPGFNELCAYITANGGAISIASIRADSITPERAQLLAASNHRTVTMAPEAGTERLRAVVAKGLQDEEIFAAAETLAAHGIINLKLYFIIGLPTETPEDIEGIITLAKQIKHHMGKGGRRTGEITLSITPFVPKAWTPFQWHPFEEIKTLKKKIQTIKKGVGKIPRARVIYDLPKWGYVQTLLAMGDRRVGDILLRVHESQGDWGATLKSSYINPDFWVYRKKEKDETFPWDFIDHGIKKGDLWKEYQEAIQ